MNESFRLDPVALTRLINTQRLIVCLNAPDCGLSMIKRQQCIDWLRNLPAQIRVAMDPSRISFDLVVEQNGLPYYWEFHEPQHRTLKDDRLKLVYGPNGEEFRVTTCTPE